MLCFGFRKKVFTKNAYKMMLLDNYEYLEIADATMKNGHICL